MRGLMMVIFEEAGTLSKRSKTKPKESSKKRKKKTVEELELELQSFNEEIGTIFLDAGLRVRRFIPKATEIIPLTAADSGRPIKDLASTLVDPEVAISSEMVLNDLASQETGVESPDDRCFLMRIRPYRTVNNVIGGVVITFEDVPILGADGAVDRLLGITPDISEREETHRDEQAASVGVQGTKPNQPLSQNCGHGRKSG